MPTYQIQRLAPFLKALEEFPRRQTALSVGDSWFQYPLRTYADLQRRAANAFNRRVLMVDDSYPGRDADEVPGLIRRWSELAGSLQNDHERPLNLILVSLGGNDIIGKDFDRHLKTAADEPDGGDFIWNTARPDVVTRHIKLGALATSFDSVRRAYESIIEMRAQFAPDATIVTHTYADVLPSDRPYTFAFIKTGPWMWTAMRAVGLKQGAAQRELSRWLLQAFANLLSHLAARHPRIVVLDTRQELSAKENWDNEIHPTGPGFKALFDQFWRPAIEQALGPP